jgi:hypothetical protein
MVVGVRGHNPAYEVVAVYGLTPTIDGAINALEWSDASSVSFNSTEVFVKQDGENLYIALNVTDAPLMHIERDYIQILLDVDHDGSNTLQPDDLLIGVFRNGTFLEANVIWGTWSVKEASGWAAVVNSTSDMWQVELNITYSKVNVFAGVEKTIGVSIGCVRSPEEGSQTQVYWPPEGYNDWYFTSPSSWGAITSAGYNWVPEFPSFVIMPLFMIMTLNLTVIGIVERHYTSRIRNERE